MTSGHLITFGNLTLLNDEDTDNFVDSWWEFNFFALTFTF